MDAFGQVEKRFIYGLYDPRTPAVVMCVGKTRLSLNARLSCYIASARRGRNLPSMKWIRMLLSKDLRPGIRLLATTDVTNWRKCEARFITVWRKRNSCLLNVHRGGNGQDSGKAKLVCGKCGGRRKRIPCGAYRCPRCSNAYNRRYLRAYWRTAKYRAWKKAWNQSAKGRAYAKAYDTVYRHSPKRRAYLRDWQRTPKRKTYLRVWRRTLKSRAYARDYCRTPKYKAYKRDYRRTPTYKAYKRDYRKAKKLGMTVSQYRQRTAA